MYCGLRSKEELDAIRGQGLVDFVVWVDASHRLPAEPISSMKLSYQDADFIIDNNGTLADLARAVDRFRLTMERWAAGRAMIQGAA